MKLALLVALLLVSTALCQNAQLQFTRKHYKECQESHHLDFRYGCGTGRGNMKSEEIFINLVASFSQFSKEHNVTFWLAHGTLLGWIWGKKPLPTDDDIDVQMTLEDLESLLPYNLKMWNYLQNNYLLDINPNYRIFPAPDLMNVIDARWIDTKTGRFIDVTIVQKCVDLSAPGDYCVRNHHRYSHDEIWPTVGTQFLGIPVRIPSKTDLVLTKEYGTNCILDHYYLGWHFKNENGTRSWEYFM